MPASLSSDCGIFGISIGRLRVVDDALSTEAVTSLILCAWSCYNPAVEVAFPDNYLRQLVADLLRKVCLLDDFPREREEEKANAGGGDQVDQPPRHQPLIEHKRELDSFVLVAPVCEPLMCRPPDCLREFAGELAQIAVELLREQLLAFCGSRPLVSGSTTQVSVTRALAELAGGRSLKRS